MFTDANGAFEINEKSQQALILYSLRGYTIVEQNSITTEV
jgi:hypothetical protein